MPAARRLRALPLLLVLAAGCAPVSVHWVSERPDADAKRELAECEDWAFMQHWAPADEGPGYGGLVRRCMRGRGYVLEVRE